MIILELSLSFPGELQLQFDAFVQELLRQLVEWLRPAAGVSQEQTNAFTRYPDLLLDTADAKRAHKHLAGTLISGIIFAFVLSKIV